MNINKAYEKLVDPATLVGHLGNKDQFGKWCDLGTKQDLIATLQQFEDAELYEHCEIILNKINKII
tara:strand:+ start:409 stop:606 length:198 start_codon:yes stop_codon:yes gene_type:complete